MTPSFILKSQTSRAYKRNLNVANELHQSTSVFSKQYSKLILIDKEHKSGNKQFASLINEYHKMAYKPPNLDDCKNIFDSYAEIVSNPSLSVTCKTHLYERNFNKSLIYLEKLSNQVEDTIEYGTSHGSSKLRSQRTVNFVKERDDKLVQKIERQSSYIKDLRADLVIDEESGLAARDVKLNSTKSINIDDNNSALMNTINSPNSTMGVKNGSSRNLAKPAIKLKKITIKQKNSRDSRSKNLMASTKVIPKILTDNNERKQKKRTITYKVRVGNNNKVIKLPIRPNKEVVKELYKKMTTERKEETLQEVEKFFNNYSKNEAKDVEY